VSPVITYLPVSPVAPPNKITFDLETRFIFVKGVSCVFTLSYSVSESGEGNLTKDLNF